MKPDANKKISAAANPPASLRKAGITGVSDNIPDGQQLAVSGDVIFQFFGKELQQRFIKGGRYGSTEPDGLARHRSGK